MPSIMSMRARVVLAPLTVLVLAGCGSVDDRGDAAMRSLAIVCWSAR
jgi:hypothetical protein